MTSAPAPIVCRRRDRLVLLASALAGGLAVALCSPRLTSLSAGWLVVSGSFGLAAAAAGDDVERLIEGVERVAAGDYDVGFDLDRDDQLGDLAAALDELVDGVARREDDFEREIEYTGEVLDAIDDIFYVLDREGGHRQWNETIAEVTGYDPAEIASMGPLDYFEGEDEAAIAAAIDEAFEAGHTRVEADLRTKDDGAVPYEWIANRLTAPDGTPVVAGIGRDISERRERERELREARDRLVQNNRSLQRLYEIGADRSTSLESKIESMLELGRERLDLSGGFVSRIDEDGDSFEFVYTSGMGEFSPGTVVPFSETFCRETITGDDILAVNDAPNQGWADDAAYDRWGYDSYIGGRVYVEDELEGTVGFVDDSMTPSPFTDDQRTFVDLVTQWLGYEFERKRKEERLEEHTQFIDDVLDSMDDVFYVVGSDFSLQRWNESLADATGYDDAEIEEMHPVDFVVEDDREAIASAVQETFEAGSARVEARILTRDGEEIPYEFVGSKLRDPEGSPVLVGVGRDITERVERERELERQASLLDSLFEQVPVNIYLKDEEAHHVRTSAPYLREDRPEEEWYVGKSDLEIYSRDAAEETYADDRRVIDSGEPIIEKEEYDEGAGRWLLTSKVPWRGEDGEIRGLIGVSQDITEQKERQQELERMRYLMRQAQQIAHVGGWELDLRSERYTFEGTEEFYRIHDVPSDAEFDPETALEYYHVDDRERITDVMTDAIEHGTSYDMEARLTTGDHGVRWVRAIAEPVTDDGDVVALRGSIQDITDRKEQELTLQSLHELARGLLEADTRLEIADLVLDAATTVLGFPCVGIYLLKEDAGRLEPAAISPEFEEICGDPTADFDAEDSSILWDAYVGGEAMEVGESTFEDSSIVAEPGHSGLLLPIGEHGVLIAASDREEITADHRRVAETLVATMETALHRLDSEEAFRANQRQLEGQNRRLRRQIQITEIIRRVDRSLVGAGTREQIESAVCERLVESDDVAFAWIGGLDDRSASVVPRTWAGAGHEYLDAISLSTAEEAPDPAVRAAVSGESALAESVVEAVTSEQWRKHALVWNFSSVIAVPLELDEFSYGVLAVYGTEPGAFGDLERNVFEELGESIANAINAVEARRALYADEFAELRLRFDGDEDFLGRVAAASGATVEYVGLATHADGESRLFFETSDADPEAVRVALDELHTVSEYRQIGEAEDPTLFEATVVGTVLAAKLVSRGGVPRSMVASGGELSVVVDVPTATDVREFLGMLQERHPSAELVARQNVRRDVQTRQEVVAGLFDDLTDRQLEVLRTAFFAGFFEWPRESTGEEVADLLDVSQPTVNRHLRHALARLLEQLFEEEPTTVASAEPS